MLVVGVDGCRVGWFAVRLDDDGGWDINAFSDVGTLCREWNGADVIFIDIPIGLPDKQRPVRTCDVQARRLLGRPRSSSIFPPASRAALNAITYTSASEANLAEIVTKLNQQTWNILPKIREVDRFLAEYPDERETICEIHPEVCFTVFNGGRAITLNKKTPEGKRVRIDLLRRVDDRADAIRDRALTEYRRKDVAEDDILDALVAAITTTHHPDNVVSIPPTPEYDAYGLRMDMVHVRM